ERARIARTISATAMAGARPPCLTLLGSAAGDGRGSVAVGGLLLGTAASAEGWAPRSAIVGIAASAGQEEQGRPPGPAPRQTRPALPICLRRLLPPSECLEHQYCLH